MNRSERSVSEEATRKKKLVGGSRGKEKIKRKVKLTGKGRESNIEEKKHWAKKERRETKWKVSV